ncbi:hypothetical protein TWF106_000789 [Orbilia oligospora]|uniref:C2H2-type domain-containing protein n=1 Tax=Orbilia oligospora TaxID=2813651 RepID=A0A7C8QWR7_ORBOL|nr:hypothetical protein TWF679_004192 [Orbilia oligospora]KAF3226294.1 hypothetical protein TWF106_000789 [Orbilia oligospora]
MPTYCNRCERPFVHGRAYQSHIEDNSRHNVCFVEDCDNDYENVDHLRQHAKDKHNACYDCEEIFDSPSNLGAHRRSALHAGREYTCPCDEKFASPAGILLHIENGGCKKFNGHELMHLISINVRRHATGYCKPGADVCIGKKSTFFVNPTKALWDEWDDHEQTAYHPRYHNYVCQYCLKRFSDSEDLREHLSNAGLRDGQVRYACTNCDAGPFDYPSGLCQHYESKCC